MIRRLVSRSRNYQKSRKYRGRWYMKLSLPAYLNWEIRDGEREWYECEGDYLRYHQPERMRGQRRSHFWRQLAAWRRRNPDSIIGVEWFKHDLYEPPEPRQFRNIYITAQSDSPERVHDIFNFFEVAKSCSDD